MLYAPDWATTETSFTVSIYQVVTDALSQKHSNSEIPALRKSKDKGKYLQCSCKRRATLFANNAIEDPSEENTCKILIIFKKQFSLFKLLRNYFLLLMLIHVEKNNFSEPLDVFFCFFLVNFTTLVNALLQKAEKL